jgi:hypothetical protein
MRGRGVEAVSISAPGRWAATVLSLALILACPVTGAGQGGGARRGAVSLAVQVDASASLVVGASLEGRT